MRLQSHRSDFSNRCQNGCQNWVAEQHCKKSHMLASKTRDNRLADHCNKCTVHMQCSQDSWKVCVARRDTVSLATPDSARPHQLLVLKPMAVSIDISQSFISSVRGVADFVLLNLFFGKENEHSTSGRAHPTTAQGRARQGCHC